MLLSLDKNQVTPFKECLHSIYRRHSFRFGVLSKRSSHAWPHQADDSCTCLTMKKRILSRCVKLVVMVSMLHGPHLQAALSQLADEVHHKCRFAGVLATNDMNARQRDCSPDEYRVERLRMLAKDHTRTCLSPSTLCV